MEPVSRANTEHYFWGDAACEGWHLVRTGALSVIEERMPGQTAERRHSHARARQFFYVLKGELTLEVERQEHLLRANEGLEIGPGMTHQALNRSEQEVRFVVTSQPPSHGDRIDA